ncbi:MAG: DUF1579 family protein [Syntrophobacteraceae bacterium]
MKLNNSLGEQTHPVRCIPVDAARFPLIAQACKPGGSRHKFIGNAIREVYKKLATTGAPHKLLESRAGSWETKNMYWSEPDKPPMESTGACERKRLPGGRYLQEEFTGEMMGSPSRQGSHEVPCHN